MASTSFTMMRLMKMNLLMGPLMVAAWPLIRNRHATTPSCRMGGYYSEPVSSGDDDRAADGRLQHMIFGVKCFEDSFQIPGMGDGPIQFLEPSSDDNTPASIRSSSMLLLAEKLLQNLNFVDANVAELGSSSIVALAAARIGGANVRVYSIPEDARLRVLQHADLYLNAVPSCAGSAGRRIKNVGSFSQTDTTFHPEDTDFILVTTPELEPFSRCLQEALDRKVPIVGSAGIENALQEVLPTGVTLECKDGILFVDSMHKLPWK